MQHEPSYGTRGKVLSSLRMTLVTRHFFHIGCDFMPKICDWFRLSQKKQLAGSAEYLNERQSKSPDQPLICQGSFSDVLFQVFRSPRFKIVHEQ